MHGPRRNGAVPIHMTYTMDGKLLPPQRRARQYLSASDCRFGTLLSFARSASEREDMWERLALAAEREPRRQCSGTSH